MRRLKREILRRQAQKMGVKPSRYVQAKWREIQNKRYGKKLARAFWVRGSRKKKNWHY